MKEFYEELKNYGPDDIIVVVGHKISNRLLEMHLLGQDEKWFSTDESTGNSDIKLLGGDFEKGFTSTKIYTSEQQRTKSTPVDHKCAPYGQPRSLT